MAIVTIHLEPAALRCLAEKAKQGGQTLETYLEQLVEHHIRAGNGSSGGDEKTDEDELAERPWRGIFVPPRPRDLLFSENLSVNSSRLPKRQPSLNMSWHRKKKVLGVRC